MITRAIPKTGILEAIQGLPRGHAVKDTLDKIERKFHDMLLARSGEERLKMGCSMHATARALVKASIPQRDPVAVNRELFLRFYGDDFEPEQREKILLALQKAAENNRKPERKGKKGEGSFRP
jgi:hypothetical protein